MTSSGGLAVSRESKRRAVEGALSGPCINQPKLEAGDESQNATSCASAALFHTCQPLTPTLVAALEAGSKSPPAVVHTMSGKNRWSQVASPAVEAAPAPPMESDVPSPQSASTRWTETIWAVELGALSTFNRSSTESMIAEACSESATGK